MTDSISRRRELAVEGKRERILEPRTRHGTVGDVPGIEDRDAGQPPHEVEERSHEPSVILAGRTAPRHEDVLLGNDAWPVVERLRGPGLEVAFARGTMTLEEWIAETEAERPERALWPSETDARRFRDVWCTGHERIENNAWDDGDGVKDEVLRLLSGRCGANLADVRCPGRRGRGFPGRSLRDVHPSRRWCVRSIRSRAWFRRVLHRSWPYA